MATIVITDTGADLFTMTVGVLTADHTKTYFARVSTGDYIRVEQHYTENSDLFNPIHFSEIEVDGVVYATANETVTALNKVIWLGSGTAPLPVPQIDVEKDVICKNETWHNVITVFTDGVQTSETETDTGIPCDQPQPIEPKIEDVEICDATTNTIHVLVNQYTYPDPTDLTNVVTTLITDIDTGIACGADVPLTVRYLDCDDNTQQIDVKHTVQTVPEPNAVQKVSICGSEKSDVTAFDCDDNLNTFQVDQTVYTVPHPKAIQTVKICPEPATIQPDQTHVIVTGNTSPVPAGLKSVTINNITGNTTVSGGYVLGNGRRDNSLSLNATELSEVRGLLPSITVVGGTFQWIGIQPIAEQ